MAKRRILRSRALALALGLFAIGEPVLAQTTPDTPMTFTIADTAVDHKLQRLLDGGDLTIYAAGTITPGTTQRFRDFIKARKISQARVYFDSAGGSVVESMELGSAIRTLNFNTDVGAAIDPGKESASMCASACAYAYAGGKSRFLNKGSGKLGIHQFYGDHKKAAMSDTQAMSGLIVAYLTDMGIDAKAFTLAALTEPDSIFWLTPENAIQLGFANNGVLPTTAEIDLVKMTPLLTLEQVRYDKIVDVVFGCASPRLIIQIGIFSPGDAPRDLRNLTSAYLEFDGQMALMERGAGAANLEGSGVFFSRDIDEETRLRLLKTNRLDAWIETGGPLRWGGPIDLKDVHPKMQDFFRQCISGETIDSATPTTPKATRLAGTLVIIDMQSGERPLLNLIDSDTIRRTGNAAQVTAYASGLDDGKPYYGIITYEFDCVGLREKSRRFYTSREGEALSSRQGIWEAVLPGTIGEATLQYACGMKTPPKADTSLTNDIFAVLRRFLDNKAYEKIRLKSGE